MKTCNNPKCKQTKPESEFYKDQSRKDGLAHWCKMCANAKAAKWREDNSEKNRASHANWYKDNTEKARAQHKKWCKENLEKVRTQHAKWCKENPERVREIRIKHKYGITSKEYDRMINLQDNKCSICNKDFIKIPHIDHNHYTGKVRGLVCNGCNIDIGYYEKFQRDYEHLEAIVKYLDKY